MLSIQASFRSVVKHAKRVKNVREKAAACSARKTYENGEAKENVDNKGTPVSGEDKEGTGNGSESRQRKAGATMKNPAQFLNIGSLED